MDDNLLIFPFERADWDAQWTLLVIALALCSFLIPPLASMLAMGVAGQIARPVIIEGSRPGMPARLEWRALLAMGARWWLVSIIFQIPALAVVAGTVGWLLHRYGLPRIGEEWAGIPQAWPVIAAALAVALPLGMFSAWLSNTAQMHLTAKGSFWAAFRIGEWARVLAANLRGFLAALGRMLLLALGVGAVQFVVSLPAAALIILPAILGSFTGLYLRCISAALYARAYREGLRRVQAEIPTA